MAIKPMGGGPGGINHRKGSPHQRKDRNFVQSINTEMVQKKIDLQLPEKSKDWGV